MDKIHENIRRIRMRNGYSQDEMADLMGVERSTYSNFETGKTKLFSKSMSLFAAAVGMTEEDIIIGAIPPARLTSGYLQEGGVSDRLDAVEARMEELCGLLQRMSVQLDDLAGHKAKPSK
jgi:transcriptional regulator with XRE-family HTH domain